jgi:hypothetical protein
LTDRRYSEDEVAKILEAATEVREAGDRSLPSGDASGDGVTLAELQDIGREVGIPEKSIELAASRLDAPVPAGSPDVYFLGRRIGVGRTVYLDRPVSDREWDLLVVDLRETFNARGKLRQEGSFRQWTNGNLQVLLEPTDSGDRLRLRTLKGGARINLAVGSALVTLGVSALAISTWVGPVGDPGRFQTLGVLAFVGGVLFARDWLRLPRWAATRARQMEDVSGRLVAALRVADRADETEEG